MVRSILAIIIGYIVLVLIVGVGVYASASVILGTADATFGVQLTPTYLAVNLLISFLAALAGGYITARLAPRAPDRHVQFLAGLLLLVGLITAAMSSQTDIGQPMWYTWVLPFLGAVGAIVGGRLYGGRA